MALIDRYSIELQSTMREVTKEMDHIRIEKLNHVKKKAVRVKHEAQNADKFYTQLDFLRMLPTNWACNYKGYYFFL